MMYVFKRINNEPFDFKLWRTFTEIDDLNLWLSNTTYKREDLMIVKDL